MSDVVTELAALRASSPVEVDVAGRVMARIATLPPPSVNPAFRPRRVAAVAAACAGIAAAAGSVAVWPAARVAIAGAVLEALALVRATGGSFLTVASVSRGMSRAFDIAGSTAAAVATALEPLRPTVAAASLALAAITVSAVVIIVVRDFSRAPVLEER